MDRADRQSICDTEGASDLHLEFGHLSRVQDMFVYVSHFLFRAAQIFFRAIGCLPWHTKASNGTTLFGCEKRLYVCLLNSFCISSF